jgi:methylenetetrahydrofolate reductase (NADPH)
MSLSFEFFPPKTDEQKAQLSQALKQLARYRPEYVSVTFGAGGSTLSYTPEIIEHIQKKTKLEAAPHLSCVGGTRDEINALLTRYQSLGCRRLVALRGDMPSGMGALGELRYASDLVSFIRQKTGDWFRIDVGCYPEVHPQAENIQSDLQNLKRKIDAGADGAITQYFFNPDAYFRFVDDARRIGIDVPIVPGIMPISQWSQLKRFSDTCGAEIPRWMAKRFTALGDDVASVRELGADLVTQLCQKLLAGGAPGLHIYTLNRAKATQAILNRLNLS